MAVNTQLQVRRGSASQWTSANPTLAAGEFGFESDTGKIKVGTGSTAWTSLAYAGMSASSTETLTNKTVALDSNTVSGTIAQFNTAVTDADFATTAGTETLTNKTISGSLNTISNIGNASLTNSSVTINGSAVSLGGSTTIQAGPDEIAVIMGALI